MKKLAIVAACAVMASTGIAQEALTYKGIKIGVTQNEFQAALPDYVCKPNYCSYSSGSCSPITARNSTAQYMAQSDACEKRTSFGGAMVTNGFASFVDGKLIRVTFTLPTFHAKHLMESITAKYGAPASVDDTPVKNRMGAEFENSRRVWVSGDDRLAVTLRSGRIEDGSAVLSGKVSAELAEKERATAKEKGAKDF